MKIFTSAFLISFTTLLHGFSAQAQTLVKETDITRQAEKTEPTDNWVGYTRNAGALNFVQGQATPPLGCGSLQFNTADGSDKAFLYNFDFNGTALSAITALSYATYQSSGLPNQVPSINMVIDFDGPAVAGGEAILVFEPIYNTTQGTVTANTWKTWDAFNGGNATWWSAQAINGVCAFSCYVTWNQILASNPQATILGGFGINQGSGNPGLIAAVDALTIGVNGTTTVFDFENNPATTNFADADGDSFGDVNNSITVCQATAPAGYVTNSDDCDDTNSATQTMVCYQGVTTCIGTNDLATYLANGATAGPCAEVIAPEPAAPEMASEASVLTYPNPTTGALNIQIPEMEAATAEIIIMNASGTVIDSRTSNANGQVENFDLAAYGPGIYLIKVITATSVEHSKVMVQ